MLVPRFRRIVLLAYLGFASSGCGFLLTKGPPGNHAQLPDFTCTESSVAPLLDVLLSGWSVVNAIVYEPPNDFFPDAFHVGYFLSTAVFLGASAAVGFRKTSRCRQAVIRLAERVGGGGAADEPSVQSVVVEPRLDTLSVGESVQLVATARGTSGAEVPNQTFVWTSSNDAIVSVNDVGFVIAHAAGQVVVAARTGLVVGSATIVVR